jgi:uncharacterized damage-inducible protein DinB
MSLYGAKQLANGIRSVRASTIQIAGDIPESDYDFRPSPGSRSVAELLTHIAWLWTSDHFIHDEQRLDALEGSAIISLIDESGVLEKVKRSKTGIIDMLRTEGDRWTRWIEQLPEGFLAEQIRLPDGTSVSRFEMLLGTKEHEIHHQAQLTVIERLLDVVPHPTRNLISLRQALA